jgi:hypothetical protein
MKNRTSARLLYCLLASLLAMMCRTASAMDPLFVKTFVEEGITFTLHDDIQSPLYSWPRTLLTYPVDFSHAKCKAADLQLIDEKGAALPMQLSDVKSGADGSLLFAKVSFFSALAPGATHTYRLRSVPGAVQPQMAAVHARREGGKWIVDAGALLLQIPDTQDVAEGAVAPGPLLALNRGQGWIGGSTVVSQGPKVRRVETTVEASGPLFSVYRVRYTFDGGEVYEATLRAVQGYPFVDFAEHMSGLTPEMGVAVEMDWAGLHPDLRYGANGWNEPDGPIVIDKPLSTPGIIEEPYWYTQDQHEDPAKEMFFQLAAFAGNAPRNEVPAMDFWESKANGQELSVFVPDTKDWDDHQYMVWQPTARLRVSFRYVDGHLIWHWPLVDGERRTGIAMVVTKTFTIVVNAATLMITTASVPNVVLGSSYASTLAATGGITPYSWSIASGALPAGIALSATGVLSGLPTATGTYNFTAQVVDTEVVPQTVQKAFTIVVYPKLAITTTSLPNGTQNSAYAQTLQATGGTAPLTWSVSSGVLPAGLTLSSTGVLSGTPSVYGSFAFTIQVVDTSVPHQTSAQAYTLVLAAPLTILTTTVPNATVNAAYSTILASSGGNAPITWSISSGSLPANLTLSATGVISGTPTQTSTSSFTVKATDATSSSASQNLTLTVTALSPLTITTSSVPNGNVGIAYTTTFAATGGTVPYTWSLATGSLPAGLSLSTAGVLSGTPTTIGTSSFTIQVKDSQPTPGTATAPFTLTIANGGATAALNGHYAFLLNGYLAGAAPATVYGFAEIGSLAFDGAGNITGIADSNAPSGAQLSLIVTGTYSLGTDSRGLMSLAIGGTTRSYTIAASQAVSGIMQALVIAEHDNMDGTGAQSSGFAKLQMSSAFTAATINGTFAFGLSGESCTGCTSVAYGPVAAVGLITGNGNSTLSAGTEDSAAYAQNYSSITLSGNCTTPSTTTGRGTLTLNPVGTTIASQPVDFTYVIVGANEFLFMSNDSHSSSALLYGDAELQQQTTYTAATAFSGRSIGYESQASGGDGSTTYPSALNARLYQLTNTASGTATLFQDANQAGTLTTSPAATNVTYTVSANGRVVVVTGGASNQVIYLYNVGVGFGLDLAASGGYPGLLRYELQVKPLVALPPIVSGRLAAGTLAAPVRASIFSGVSVYAPDSGGADPSAYNGSVSHAFDTSSTLGLLASDQTSSFSTAENSTGRQIETTTPTGTAPSAVTYMITGTHAVSIPATGSAPTVTTLQQ